MLPEDREAIVATAMNGEALPPDHGAPARLLLPGVVGARNVKWLEKIVVRREMGASPWDASFYKNKAGEAIMHWPVTSSVTHVNGVPTSSLPKREVTVYQDRDRVRVQGYAFAGGGERVAKVDVSLDDGATWHAADFTRRELSADGKRQWTWTLWEAQLPCGLPDESAMVVCCRATDASGNTQPLTAAEALEAEPSGYLFNAVHRVRADVNRIEGLGGTATCSERVA